MFGTFYQFITNQEYSRAEANKPREKSRSRSRSRNPRRNRDDQGTFSGDDTRDRRRKYGGGERADGPADGGYTESGKDGDDWPDEEADGSDAPGRPYKQMKHIFEIKVHQLKNIPVLNKFIV